MLNRFEDGQRDEVIALQAVFKISSDSSESISRIAAAMISGAIKAGRLEAAKELVVDFEFQSVGWIVTGFAHRLVAAVRTRGDRRGSRVESCYDEIAQFECEIGCDISLCVVNESVEELLDGLAPDDSQERVDELVSSIQEVTKLSKASKDDLTWSIPESIGMNVKIGQLEIADHLRKSFKIPDTDLPPFNDSDRTRELLSQRLYRQGHAYSAVFRSDYELAVSLGIPKEVYQDSGSELVYRMTSSAEEGYLESSCEVAKVLGVAPEHRIRQ